MRTQHTDWTAIVAGICAMGAAADSAQGGATWLGESQTARVTLAWNGIGPPLPPTTDLSGISTGPGLFGTFASSLGYFPRADLSGQVVTNSGVSYRSAGASITRQLAGSAPEDFTSVTAHSHVGLSQGALDSTAFFGMPYGFATTTFEFQINEPTPFAFEFETSQWGQQTPFSVANSSFAYLWRTDIPGGANGPGNVASCGYYIDSGQSSVRTIHVSGLLLPGPYAVEFGSVVIAFSITSDAAGLQLWSDLSVDSSVTLTLPAPGASAAIAMLVAFGTRRRRVATPTV